MYTHISKKVSENYWNDSGISPKSMEHKRKTVLSNWPSLKAWLMMGWCMPIFIPTPVHISLVLCSWKRGQKLHGNMRWRKNGALKTLFRHWQTFLWRQSCTCIMECKHPCFLFLSHVSQERISWPRDWRLVSFA